jgi:integrase
MPFRLPSHFTQAEWSHPERCPGVRLGPKIAHDGWLKFTQDKNSNRKPVSLEIPIIAELQRIIDATTPVGKDTYLVTHFGRPFTPDGFGNRFRKWCDEAGLSHCSAHGLRKAGSARLAELGTSDREIMAITGHQTAKVVDRYTKGARQRSLAASAMKKWEHGQNE